jgi:hypothetical protein
VRVKTRAVYLRLEYADRNRKLEEQKERDRGWVTEGNRGKERNLRRRPRVQERGIPGAQAVSGSTVGFISKPNSESTSSGMPRDKPGHLPSKFL